MSQIKLLARHDAPVTSPVVCDGQIFAISSNGDIFKYTESTNDEYVVEAWGNSSGQPLGLAFDSSKTCFVADSAHQAIFRISSHDSQQEIEPYVSSYESHPFHGPHSIVVAQTSGMLFFTDPGHLGDTGLQNPTGSVFLINPETQLLIPLSLQCLAYPTGLALSPDEKSLYVCETCQNRLLRFTESPPGVFQCSVFTQLTGRFGPTAIALTPAHDIFVAHYEFATLTEQGKILHLNSSGEIQAVIPTPAPQITGLSFLQTENEDGLLVTEATTCSLFLYPL